MQIIEFYGLKTSQFEQKIGVSNGAIRNSMRRKGGLSSDILSKILDKYPEISPDWLLLGKGEMLRENTPEREGNTPRYTDFFEMLHEKDRQIAEKDRQMSQLLTAICNLTNK